MPWELLSLSYDGPVECPFLNSASTATCPTGTRCAPCSMPLRCAGTGLWTSTTTRPRSVGTIFRQRSDVLDGGWPCGWHDGSLTDGCCSVSWPAGLVATHQNSSLGRGSASGSNGRFIADSHTVLSPALPQAYCAWLSEQDKSPVRYRVITEAEHMLLRSPKDRVDFHLMLGGNGPDAVGSCW